MNPLLILIPSETEYTLLAPQNQVGAIWEMCGIGPAASAFMTAQWIARHQPKRVILAGIAGAHRHSGLKLGQVVTTRSECFADLGCHRDHMPVRFGNMALLRDPCGEALGTRMVMEPAEGLDAVDSLTVSTVSSSWQRADYLATTECASIENMEGAAVALACRYLKIPFHQIRSISNWMGDRDKSNWKIAEACARLKVVLDGNLELWSL